MPLDVGLVSAGLATKGGIKRILKFSMLLQWSEYMKVAH